MVASQPLAQDKGVLGADGHDESESGEKSDEERAGHVKTVGLAQ